MKTFLIASDRIINGQGHFKTTQKLLSLADKLNIKSTTFTIVPLSHPWNAPLKKDHFKSGASVMAALERGRQLLAKGKVDLIIIEGRDYLKSEYEKSDRERLMKLYDQKYSPLDGYEILTREFLHFHKISEVEYFELRDLIFNNLLKTWKKRSAKNQLPEEKWYHNLTHYFRGVDCANPHIDWEGRIILTSKKVANKLNVSPKDMVEIAGNAHVKLKEDGMESIPSIKSYRHLNKALISAMNEAKLKNLENVELDLYTCYPVVPLGFLLSTNTAKKNELKSFIKKKPLTITGGLNLARAPWNLTSLNSLIEMSLKLKKAKSKKWGLVHGNGSLGSYQGITILKNL